MVLLKSLAVFGVAFVMRPLGGMLIGWIGDTAGRRRALEVSIVLMLFPSFLIGCLPSYAQIGWCAPVLLVLLRCLQGLAAGGEIVGAYIYTIEATEGVRKGFWGGACKATGNLGTSLGIGLVTALRLNLPHDKLYSWGWRIPFWTGLVFGVIGVWVRSSLARHHAAEEGSEYDRANSHALIQVAPTSTVMKLYWPEILVVFFVAAFWCCSYYTTFVWMAYFMQEQQLSGGIKHGWIITFAANLALVVALPLGGSFGDFNGKMLMNVDKGIRFSLQFALLLMIAFSIPAFLLILTDNLLLVVIGQILFIIPVAIYGANLPAFMVSQFVVQFRFSGIGIGKKCRDYHQYHYYCAREFN